MQSGTSSHCSHCCYSQTSSGGKSSQDIILDLAADILSKIPREFDTEQVQVRTGVDCQSQVLLLVYLEYLVLTGNRFYLQRKYPVLYEESMNTVLLQELLRCVSSV